MGCRTGKKQANGFVSTPFENQRSRVARSAERLRIQADDNDLILERYVTGLVLNADVRFNAGNSPDCEARRASELMHDHVNLDGRLSRGRPNEQHRVSRQVVIVQLRDGAIYFIRYAWHQW